MATKTTPDPLVRDGQILLGTPLHRLQSAFDDVEQGVFVGDLKDVCSACDSSDKTVAKLVKMCGDKRKGERVVVPTDEVEYLTLLLTEPPTFQVESSKSEFAQKTTNETK